MKNLSENNLMLFKQVYPFYKNFIFTRYLDNNQKDEFTQASIAFDNCFILAKQNKIAEAAVAYTECCKIQAKLDPTVVCWIMALHGPRLSYFNYKTKNYRNAIKLTEDLITINQNLYEKGFHYMFYSKIQQVHNLSRIYFRMGNINTAISLSVSAILDVANYSIGKIKKIIFINESWERKLMASIQYGMIMQVLLETLVRIIRDFRLASIDMRFWVKRLLDPLVKINFTTLNREIYNYRHLDATIIFLKDLIVNNQGIDENNLVFVEKHKVDKELLSVLCKYIQFYVEEIENSCVAE